MAPDQLVLRIAELARPGRIDLEQAAGEARDAHQVVGRVPDAVALLGASAHLLRKQRVDAGQLVALRAQLAIRLAAFDGQRGGLGHHRDEVQVVRRRQARLAIVDCERAEAASVGGPHRG